MLDAMPEGDTKRKLIDLIEAKAKVDRTLFDASADLSAGEAALGTLDDEDVPLYGVWQDCDDMVSVWAVQSQLSVLSSEEGKEQELDYHLFKAVDEVFWECAAHAAGLPPGTRHLTVRKGFTVVQIRKE